jgi:glyoxylase-like metal-dependent hydrolase (beta-lactamase superfamily II)
MMKLLPALLVTAALSDVAPKAVEDKYLETIKVSENVYVFKPKIDWSHGNGVAILAPEGVFFIDTYLQFNYAEEAIRRLKKVTRLPVKYVFNTHSHNDHTSGNGVFRRVYPESRLIVNEAAVVGLEGRVKAKVEGEKAFIAGELAQADTEVKLGKTRGGTPLVGLMKAYWELSLREAREYQQQYRPEKYVSPDIVFGDTLVMRWGDLTLKMIHMADNGHSRADMIVWIPEQRLLVAGDLVVAPTPYYSLPGITKAVRALIAMNPAIIIPGHGPVEYDLSYMQLLERGFSTYQRAAGEAVAARIPERRALDSIRFPDIDRAFTGGDEMKTWAYRRFFTDNVIHLTYQAPSTASLGATPAPTNAHDLRLDSLLALQLENVKADLVDYRGRRALHLLPRPGTFSAGWQGRTEAMAIVAGSDFKNGVIDVELAGAPMAGAREGSRGFVGLAFRTTPHASSFESFYLRPTNGRADDQLRRNHSAQYQAFPDYQWDRLRQDAPGVYESYVDLVPGQWTTMRIVVAGTKAQLYVNGATQPTLVVNDLKLGESSGPIGLWIGQDTEAYFSTLSVTPNDQVAARPPAPSDSDEIALGAALVVQFDKDRGVASTPQTQRIEAYLQRIADSLGRHTARKLPWRIHYDPHPGIKSGFALPGGHIVIWGGVLAYMSTEDEAAAIIAHEIEHTDAGQVGRRLDSLTKTGRDVRNASQWKWQEFGATYGEMPERLCDSEGAKLIVKAGYSPLGMKTLLESFIALGTVHAPSEPPNKLIADRVTQIAKQIIDERWESLTKTRPLRLPP